MHSFFHVQDLGLQADHNNDRETYSFIKKVMALSFQPAREIPAMYAWLQEMASTQKLQQLMQYVGRNWITGDTWPPSSWSVFMKSVRTNNDIEGCILGWIAARLESPSFLYTSWSAFFTTRPVGQPFRSGLCQRRSYGASRKKSSETSKPRSLTSGTSSTLVPAVQEIYWRRVPTSTAQ